MYPKRLILVNKDNPLTEDYTPAHLTEAPMPFDAPACHPKRLISGIAYKAAKDLFLASCSERLNLVGVSGYRPYERQKEIYENSISERGLEYTQLYIAAPGTSEHQTGLAIDVSCPAIFNELIEQFAFTREGIWLAEHAHEFGFIIRYPKDAKALTGFSYEPWHIRYVGKKTAKIIYENSLVLEEYLQAYSQFRL